MPPEEHRESSFPLWTECFKVRSYEVDAKRRATLEVVCRYLQEAAWNHAEALGVGYRLLEKQGRLWVLSRFVLRVQAFPLWGESVTVRTWPRFAKSVFAMRDFEMMDASGRLLATAASAWLVLDTATRRPQRMDKMLSAFGPISSRRATESDPAKLPACPPDSPRHVQDVRYSDIDVNSHVNNTRYIAWIQDLMTPEFLSKHRVRQLQVNFLGETRVGERVEIATRQTGPGEYGHTIWKAGAAAEVCRARLTWTDSETPTEGSPE
jgi:acyl-ACP thioesterase